MGIFLGREPSRSKSAERLLRTLADVLPPQPLPHPRSIYFMSPTWEQCFDILGTTGLLLLSWNKPHFQCRNFARHLKAKSPLVFTLFLVWTLPTLGWVCDWPSWPIRMVWTSLPWAPFKCSFLPPPPPTSKGLLKSSREVNWSLP